MNDLISWMTPEHCLACFAFVASAAFVVSMIYAAKNSVDPHSVASRSCERSFPTVCFNPACVFCYPVSLAIPSEEVEADVAIAAIAPIRANLLPDEASKVVEIAAKRKPKRDASGRFAPAKKATKAAKKRKRAA
jgi:hypothetical protein